MIGVLLCLVAFCGTWWAANRSLGHGVGVTMAVGYAYGILRANFPDGSSHFLFDAAVAAVYAASFRGRARSPEGARRVALWIGALMAWPCLLMLVPTQHVLVQLVGLRAAIWFLPCVLLGARLGSEDLKTLARWLAGLNLVALGFGVAEFVLGVERFYPYNAVTDLIYRSNDAGDGQLRIPGVFPNAHAYGGTMVASLPLILGAWVAVRAPRERLLFTVASFAAAVGVFLCAARQPVVYLFLLGVLFFLLLPLSSGRRLTGALLVLLVAVVVGTSERLQRFSSLADPEKVTSRIQGSVNMTFVELLLEHPLGEGLASASGTSIPFFLEPLAKPQVGLENEWGRIAMEQSLLGLALWGAFVARTLLRYPRGRSSEPWLIGRRLAWGFLGMVWGTAFIGTGMLTSIPGTVVMLIYMGVLWRDPGRARPHSAESPERAGIGQQVRAPVGAVA